MSKKGFTLSEMLIVLMIIGILSAVTAPMLSIRKKDKNYEQNSLSCVRVEQASNLSSASCAASIKKAQYGQDNAINTLAFLADNGKNSSEKTAARKVLKQACDNGGDKACNYFVKACQRNYSACDTTGTANGYDLRSYLELIPNTNASAKFLIYDQAKFLYDSNNTNIKNITDKLCCNPNFNFACTIKGCSACLNGYTWGANTHGQIGDNTTVNKLVPTLVYGTLVYSQIAAGGTHMCGITKTGKAYCWGNNDVGQLGDNTLIEKHVPTAVNGSLTFSQILASGNTAGHSISCGLTTSGAGYCWGNNTWGQLGDGTTTDRSVPTPVTGGLTFSQISAGMVHSCGLTTAGKAYCWGSNGNGEIGDGSTTQRLTPTAVSGGLTFSQISTGDGFTCGITTTNKLYCWGDNYFGQLGVYDYMQDYEVVPVLVDNVLTFSQVAAGSNHACAIGTDGKAYCWGYNNTGCLGTGDSNNKNSPTAVSGSITFSKIAAGYAHTCAIATSGAAYCWGAGYLGATGNGGSDAYAPSAVSGGLKYSQISAGDYITGAIRSF